MKMKWIALAVAAAIPAAAMAIGGPLVRRSIMRCKATSEK